MEESWVGLVGGEPGCGLIDGRRGYNEGGDIDGVG